MNFLQLLIPILVLVQDIQCKKAGTWDFCGCRFLDWGPWSQCTVSCGGGGSKVRSRKVRHYVKPGCTKFTHCASNDEGSQYDSCNRICFNGGSFSLTRCNCVDGWMGNCCTDRVTCGFPGNIANGQVNGKDFTYGKSVTYSCNDLHNMTGGHRVRTCTKDGLWTARAPQCIYVNTCLSNPCSNGGTCVDGLNRYNCQCLPGWGGVHCSRDIQPPVMSGCPSDMSITTGERSTLVNWTEPSFYDPLGTQIIVTRNIPTNQWRFPWGDFTVQITASKPSNGLSTECIFIVKVRPHRCPALNIPNFGAKVCNGWRKDLGEYCLVFCNTNHDVYPRFYRYRWYVCGASGVWKPGNKLPDCEASFDTRYQRRHGFHFESCTNASDVASLQQTYIDRLTKSQYSYFCNAFNDLCHHRNVDVVC
ncbi:sushi, von Willebrand factor type A, EGF and pentraxin domain-containing protein 1-like [Pecten maximus]|uniref:sushi, von Willebrand factor type A, EGF and pentraxin domain-containing protein 1-like n=1 Tax=Pecten maximus TaxID=6579 RepID=UPI0014586E88|nr:sushi, von Willebrand factor type A, EGF and pentraxin domain-containing protein 1-like [Pecten maximus]